MQLTCLHASGAAATAGVLCAGLLAFKQVNQLQSSGEVLGGRHRYQLRRSPHC